MRLKYKMGFEDSDGVTRRFNYCRPGATYNFCHRPIAAFRPLGRPNPGLSRSASSSPPPPPPPSPPPPATSPPPGPPRDFSALPERRPIFSRERRFFSALLPEPQNGAKMRYRFAEPGLAADRSADLVRASTPPLPPLFPLVPSSPVLLLSLSYSRTSIHRRARERTLFSPFESFALEMSGESFSRDRVRISSRLCHPRSCLFNRRTCERRPGSVNAVDAREKLLRRRPVDAIKSDLRGHVRERASERHFRFGLAWNKSR